MKQNKKKFSASPIACTEWLHSSNYLLCDDEIVVLLALLNKDILVIEQTL